jgi:hypothetical protein
MPLSEEQVWRRRALEVLDRDGTSLEGAFSPRARRNPARGGAQPPSEAESCSRGRPAPERGGTSPEGTTSPRARQSLSVRCRAPRTKRSSARGWPGRLSDGSWALGFISRVLLGSFAFVFYEGKRVFPGYLGDPYGCPRQSWPTAVSALTVVGHGSSAIADDGRRQLQCPHGGRKPPCNHRGSRWLHVAHGG